MNLSAEHVLMFALVICALYYLMNKCDCRRVEGLTPFSAEVEECITDAIYNNTVCRDIHSDQHGSLVSKWASHEKTGTMQTIKEVIDEVNKTIKPGGRQKCINKIRWCVQ